MSGIQRPAALEALNTRLFKTFQAGMLQPRFSSVNAFFTDVPSSSEFNTYAWLANLGGMREWIGPRVLEGLKERLFTIYNKNYEKTISVLEDKLNDGQLADAQFAMEQLVEAAATLKDDLLLDLIENGASRVGYDGQNFFDTDHPQDLDASGTQRNYYASGLGFDATNLKAIVAAMQGFKNENGKPMGIGDRGLVALFPPALWGTALDALEAKTLTNGGENILVTKYNVTPISWARLTSSTRYYVFDLSSPGPKPFIFQSRQAPRYVSKTAPSDDNVFSRKELVWGVDARAGAGYGMWQKAFSASS